MLTMTNQFSDVQFLPQSAFAWESRFLNDVDNPIWDMVVDSDGNTYVVGRVDGPLADQSYAGIYDSWIAKYSPDGELLWVEQFGTPQDDRIWGVSLYEDTLYVAGRTSGSLAGDFAGETDIFVAQYDLDGNQIWVEQMGTPALEATNSVEVDPAGNPVVVGWSEGLGDTRQGVVTLKYDTDGNLVYNVTSELSEQITLDSRIVVGGGYIDADGFIYAAGEYTTANRPADGFDVFASKHDADGTLLWEATLTSSADERCFDVEVDGDGNVYIVGWTLGNLEGSSAGQEDAYIAKFDPDGTLLWVDQFGTEYRDFAYGLAIDDAGNVYVTGYSQHITDDNEAMYATSWLAYYDNQGNAEWLYYLETDYNDFARGIDLDPAGNVYLSGYTLGEKGENPIGVQITVTTVDKDKDSWVIKLDADILPTTPQALATTAEDTPLLLTATSLIAGTNTVNGIAPTLQDGSLTVSAGALVDNGDGTFTYTPPANFNGEVTLAYNLVDANGGVSPQQHTVVVTAVNDSPASLTSSPPSLVAAGNAATPGRAWAVATEGTYAYVADNDPGVQIFDISDPANPALVGTVDTPTDAWGVTVVDTQAYIVDRYAGLYVVDISNPANPTTLGTYDTPGIAEYVTVAGTYAYVADSYGGLHIIDVSDPTNPTLAATVADIGFVEGVAVADGYAYAASEQVGVQMIDVSDPTNPTVVATYLTSGMTEGVTIAGSVLYVADGEAGLHMLDVSDPTNPVLLGTYDSPGYARMTVVEAGYAYLADRDGGLQVVDVSDPVNPTLVASYDTPDAAWRLAVQGDYVYIADRDGGLQVVELAAAVGNSLVSIDPVSELGATLMANTALLADADGLPALGTYIYQWQQASDAGWSDIPEATAITFTPTEDHLGQSLRVQVTYTDRDGTTELLTSDAVTVTAAVGQTTPAPTVLLAEQHTADTDGDGTLDRTTLIEYTYNDQGRLSAMVAATDTTGDGKSDATTATAYTYTPQGQLVTETTAEDRNGDGINDAMTTLSYLYDASGTLREVTTTYDLNGDGIVNKSMVTTYLYNSQGQLQFVLYREDAGNDGTVDHYRTYAYTYTAEGDPASVTFTLDYGADGVIDNTFVTIYSYDLTGNLIETGQTQRYSDQATVPDYGLASDDTFNILGTPAFDGTTTYTYGADGELVSTLSTKDFGPNGSVDQQTATVYGYDAFGNLVLAVSTQDLGNDGSVDSLDSITYTYGVAESSTDSASAALLDLTGLEGAVAIEFTVNREAAYDNFVGYYKITDASGGIDLDGDGIADILPGDAGYTEAALATYETDLSLVTANGQESVILHSLEGGNLYAPLLVVDGHPADPASVDTDQVYFAFTEANADGLDHIQISGNTLMFEDIAGGGDRDFNDVVVTVIL